MKQLNCLIIDDEPIAREAIAEYCKEFLFLNIEALCKNALQANQYLQKQQIDLVFLDIDMPLISGMDWLKSLKKPPSIIMTTAYTEYALESFSYNIIDYLIKPISPERFLQAINKVNKYYGDASEDEILFVKSEQQIKKIKIGDILFAEAMQNYVKVVTAVEQMIIHMPLKSFKNQLPDTFIQTHKSYIVSKYKVDSVKNNQVIIGKYEIPISVRLKRAVLSSFKL